MPRCAAAHDAPRRCSARSTARGSAPRRARSRPPTSRSGASRSARKLGDRLGGHRVDLGDDPLGSDRISVLVISDLPSRRHAVRRRLHREHDPALEVVLRALELLVATGCPRRCRGSARRRSSRHSRRLSSRVADVEPDLARVRVLRRERVDRVGHPALLADLLEEPRRGRPAEDRVEQRDDEAAPVGARDPGRREAHVVLLRLLPLEAQPGRGRAHERRADRPARCLRGLAGRAPRAAQQLARARGCRPPRRRRSRARTSPGGSDASERREIDGDHLRRPHDRPAERVAPEHRLGDEVVDVAPAACPRTSRSPRARPRARRRGRRSAARRPCRSSRRSPLELVVGHARVDDRVLARGGRVQLAAEAVEDLRDLLRRVVARALEEQVLDEVRRPRPARCVSSREPAPIQKPSDTERTPSTCSVTTRSPESSSDRTYRCTGGSYPCPAQHQLSGATFCL